MKRVIKIKNVTIGDGHIVIQSMTNTRTSDIEKTIEQINALVNAGAELVRVAVKDENDAVAIKQITESVTVPIIADIHFDHHLALLAIDYGAAKIRINPGNMNPIHLESIIKKCQEKNIPIRIGVNSGSLSPDIVAKYGITPNAMIKELEREIRLFEKFNFHDIVLSLKATDIETFIQANELASSSFEYPLHIGLTEAGPLLSGSIRSSYAIGTLLKQNIGDTIRVSLTGNPVNEILAAKEILKMFNKYQGATLISCPTCGRCEYNMEEIINTLQPFISSINYPIKVAIMGCVVNGIGEGKHADIGIAGGNKQGVIFRNGTIIKKVSEENLVDEFKKEINNFIKEKFH